MVITILYMHILKLSDIILHTALNVSFTAPQMAHRTILFSRVYSYCLLFARKYYSIAGFILLIILRGHMPGFGQYVVLR